MENVAQTCVRLLLALEDLAAREAAAVQTQDFSTAVEIQGRAEPLIEYIATHGPAVADNALRGRVWDFLRRRALTADSLARQLAQAREDLQGTRASQHRAARMAPVYGSVGAPVARQLLAVG